MSTLICSDFRLNVNRLLESRGISRSELARRMDCSPAFVTQMLRDTYTPGLNVIQRVADAIGVPAATLLKKTSETTD